MRRDPVYTPSNQIDRLIMLAMSLGSDHSEAFTPEHGDLYAEYLLRKPMEYFENKVVTPRHLAQLFIDCRETPGASGDPEIEKMREADRLYFGLCGRKQDKEAAAHIYEHLCRTNKEADAMLMVIIGLYHISS